MHVLIHGGVGTECTHSLAAADLPALSSRARSLLPRSSVLLTLHTEKEREGERERDGTKEREFERVLEESRASQ